MQKKLSDLEIKDLEYSHLGLDLTTIDLDSLQDPFANYYSTDNYMEILRIMRDPANFAFTCKYVFNVEPIVFQLVWLDCLWNYAFPMLIAGRGSSKSFMVALYFCLRATITQGCKIIITSASFRQAKMVFDYIEGIWLNAPVWRDLCGGGSGPSRAADMFTFRIGKSTIVAIPLGTGEKVRGLRGNYVLVEEFGCLDKNTLIETNNGLIRISEVVKNKELLLLNKNGDYEKPISYITTPLTDVYEIVTERGYSFKCSNIHKVLTTKGFILAKYLKEGDCIISENKYIFPEKIITNEELTVDENLAWVFGILISEGYINTKNTFGILMTDEDCVKRFGESILKINPNQYIRMIKKESYQDIRFKSKCKPSFNIGIHNTLLRNKFEYFGLDRVKCYDKKIPWSILQSPRYIVVKFMAGLFEGDGSCFLWSDKWQNNRLGIAYYTVSKQLAQEVQILLKKLGYLSNLLSRKSNLSDKTGYMVRLNGLYAYQFANELKIDKWNYSIENCYEKNIEDKPTINYAKSINRYLVNCRIDGKCKRIGKTRTYEEALELYNKNNIEHLIVKKVYLLPDKDILYDFELPDTHSFYGNGLVQHNSVPEDIFEIVLRGFTATSNNPVENIKTKAKLNKLREKNLLTPELEKEITGLYKPNQIILSGTAGWDFQHFAKYWKKYRRIIKSGGDPNKLKDALGNIPEKGFDYKDYCVIRMPAKLLPEGMLDEKAISNAKLTMDESRFQLEYSAVFVKDSNGFIPRTLIESCSCKDPIQVGNNLIKFPARIRGDSAGKYILGCDPASESDNLAIVILENYKDHNRVVYCWTIRRAEVFKRFQNKDTQESNFYAFIARKIRTLMSIFPIEYIAMDSQGGGIAVSEALHDLKKLEPGEVCIWPLRMEDPIKYSAFKDYGYDDEQGLHILEMVSMSCSEYVVEANHGLKKDLQNKMLLFPYTDALTLAMADMVDDKSEKYDTLEDCILEVDSLKDELSTIVHSSTQNGRDRFDTPETIGPQGKKTKMRKDRYSALLMANALARRLFRQSTINYDNRATGGFINQYQGQDHSGQMYVGNDEFVQWANQSLLGVGVGKPKEDPFSYYR